MPKLLGFGPPDPPDRGALARDALTRGQAALAAGDRGEAVRWLDRACRLVPEDAVLNLTLAWACVGWDEARAQHLFAAAAERWPLREAWLGLAAASRTLGDRSGAAAALVHALSCFAMAPGFDWLADAVAHECGAPGWCGVTDGKLAVRLADANAVAEVSVGERVVGTPRAGTHPLPLEVAGHLHVRSAGRPLLGSPIMLSSIARSEGFVEARDGGVAGWLWHPRDPDREPIVTIQAGRRDLRVRATEPASLPSPSGFARARSFHVSSERLAAAGLAVAGSGCVHVRGANGRDLLGSPLDPGWERAAAEAAAGLIASRLARVSSGMRARAWPSAVAIQADIVGRAPAGGRGRPRKVDVVVPVHGAPEMVRACLDSVLASVDAATRVIVVDDGSVEPELATLLDGLLRQKRIALVRHREQLGFPASANAGMRASGDRDVVLLNSDTLVPPGWLERLRDAAYQAPDIGTATPLSNSATILSYPGEMGRNRTPGLAESIAMSRLADRANAGRIVEIPVAVGFCMYIRRDCLDAVGLFRADLFAQGYGEENDFCLRARHLGWRHVAAAGVYVGHCGGGSFGAAGPALRARNQAILNRLHPGYDRLIADWAAAEPMADSFRRFDLARWRAARRRGSRAVILITHADGGGVERRVVESCAAHRAAGRRPVVLRPDPDGLGVVVSEEAAEAYPNLRYGLPAEMGTLARLLRGEAPVLIELHHVLGHSPAVYEVIGALGLPYDVHVHDWVWICPRIILIGPDRRYCGEPDAVSCDACVADAGRAVDEAIPTAALRERSARLLSAARRVLVPSKDTALRLCRHFPDLSPLVVPHEDDAALPPVRARRGAGARARIAVIGAIGVAKGYDVLLACARDAARRALPLEFVLVGHSIDDQRLIETGHAFVTGQFQADEAVTLIQAQQADLALLPSIWPETWCYALTDGWRAGLQVAAFDIGAPAERIRRTGRGFLMPLGLSAARINDAMLAACLQSVHECAP